MDDDYESETILIPGQAGTQGSNTTTNRTRIMLGSIQIATSEKTNGISSIYYQMTNPVGSSTITTDPKGTILQSQDTKPYGGYRVNTESKPIKDRYALHERDSESGLTYMQARYYSENNRHFLSLDPTSQYNPKSLITDPQQLNLYSYARNNPIRYNDPSGKYSVKSGRVQKGDTLKSITKSINLANNTKYTDSQIGKLNKISGSNPLRVNQILIPNNNVKDITNSLINISKGNSKDKDIHKGSGIVSFYKKVDTGGVWDFKHDKKSEYYSPNNMGGYVFDGEKVDSDFPGNFHFGYVGASTWWGGKQLLLVGAGTAQAISDIKSSKATIRDNILPYLDNPGDSSQIKQGIDYYKNN